MGSSDIGWYRYSYSFYDDLSHPNEETSDLKLLSWESSHLDTLITSIDIFSSLGKSGLVFAKPNEHKIFQYEGGIKTWRQRRCKHFGERAWLKDKVFISIGHDLSSFSQYSNLEELNVSGVSEFPLYIEDIKTIEELNVAGFKDVNRLLDSIHFLTDLRKLTLVYGSINRLPTYLDKLQFLKSLHVDGSTLRKPPSSFSGLASLTELSIRVPKRALISWHQIFDLENLKRLTVYGASKWWEDPIYDRRGDNNRSSPSDHKLRGKLNIREPNSNVEEITFYRTKVRFKLEEFFEIPSLKRLTIRRCIIRRKIKLDSVGSNISFIEIGFGDGWRPWGRKTNLKVFPGVLLSAPNLDTLDLSWNNIRKFQGLPEESSVQVLNLSVNNIKHVPEGIGNLSSLI